MFKKIFSFLTIAIALGLIGVSTIRANTYEVDDNIVSDYNSTVHFNQNGNDFDGMIWRAGDTTVTPGEVVDLSGVQKTCMKQLKGYYYNNQRGTRVRPLDSDSLEVLSGLDSSYANLTLAGGLRRACSGENQWNVYGQVTHTYNGDTFKLLAGVEYNFVSGTYLGTFSGNMEYKNIFNKYSANGYLRDTAGGIAPLTSNITLIEGNTSLTGTVASGTFVDLTGDIVVTSTGGYVEFSGVDIVVTGGVWDGVIIPPTVVTGPEAASIGEAGIPTTGTILFTTQVGASGTSLEASGGNFIISLYVPTVTVGQTLEIYRSEDGVVWIPNSPDTTCMVDVYYMCTFATDHLSYFVPVILGTSDGIRTTLSNGQTCSDLDGCVCNGSNINNGQTCTIGSSYGGGGGSYNLRKDDCERDSRNGANNLPGANEDGDDESESYYDRTCEDDGYMSYEDNEPIRLGSIYRSPFSREMDQAYLYGYANILTLSSTIQEAGMKDTMQRKEMAAMMSSYAMRILGLSPDADREGCDDFQDLSRQTAETQLFIRLSCQLGLMGLDTDGNAKKYFEPNKIVTRSHFATVFSRMLFGDRYDGGLPYYEKHFAGLSTHGIIKSQQYAAMLERKGYILLMMLRADTNDVGRAIYHASPSEQGADALLNDY